MYEHAYFIRHNSCSIDITADDLNETENLLKKYTVRLNIHTPTKSCFEQEFLFHFYREKSAKKLFNAFCELMRATKEELKNL